jgi:hypothetical protein
MVNCNVQKVLAEFGCSIVRARVFLNFCVDAHENTLFERTKKNMERIYVVCFLLGALLCIVGLARTVHYCHLMHCLLIPSCPLFTFVQSNLSSFHTVVVLAVQRWATS